MAAVRLLEVTETVVGLSPTEAAEVQRALSTDEAGDRLAAEVEAQMVDLWAELPTGLDVRVAPIEARTTKIDTGWMVSIWYVEILTIGSELVLDRWQTVTYTLVWEHKTWKIAERVSVPGPVPTPSQTTPTTAVAAIGLLGGFDDTGLIP